MTRRSQVVRAALNPLSPARPDREVAQLDADPEQVGWVGQCDPVGAVVQAGFYPQPPIEEAPRHRSRVVDPGTDVVHAVTTSRPEHAITDGLDELKMGWPVMRIGD